MAMFGRRQAVSDPDQIVTLDEHRSDPSAAAKSSSGGGDRIEGLLPQLQSVVFDKIDPPSVGSVSRKELSRRVGDIVQECLELESLDVDAMEQREIVSRLVEAVLAESRAANGGGRPPGTGNREGVRVERRDRQEERSADPDGADRRDRGGQAADG